MMRSILNAMTIKVPPAPSRGIKTLLLLILCSLFGGSGFPVSFGNDAFDPPVKAFPPESYPAHVQIFCGSSLDDGRTLFGTADAILVYDGENFRKISVGKGKSVYAMDVSPRGKIYLGGNSMIGQLSVNSSGKLEYRSLTEQVPDSIQKMGTIRNVHAGKDGRVHFNSKEHLFILDGKENELEVRSPRVKFYQMHFPGEAPVLQDVKKGFYRFTRNGRELLPNTKKLSLMGVVEVLPDSGKRKGTEQKEDTEWTVFTRQRGLFRYDPKKGEREPLKGTRSVLGQARVYCATSLDPSQNPYGAVFAVGTEAQGVHLLDREGEVLKRIGKEEGVPSSYIWDLVPTGTGDLWATTNHGIALIETGSPFTYAWKGDAFKGLPTDLARNKEESAGGKERPSFLLTTLQGAWSFDEEGKGALIEGSKGQCVGVKRISSTRTEEGAQNLLIAHNQKGVLQVEQEGPSTFASHSLVSLSTPIHELELFPSTGPTKERGLAMAGDKLLWIGSFLPSSKGNEKPKAERRSFYKGLPEDPTSMMAIEAPSDSIRLWMSFDSHGIMKVSLNPRLTEYRIDQYDSTDGLPSGPTWIHRSPEDQKPLIGTDQGLYRYKEKGFVPCCRLGNALCEGKRTVFQFEHGPDGSIWVNDRHHASLMERWTPMDEGYRTDSLSLRPLGIGTIRKVLPGSSRTIFAGNDGVSIYHQGMKEGLLEDRSCLIRKVLGKGDSLLFGGNQRPSEEGRSDGPAHDSGGQPASMMPVLPFEKNQLRFHFAAFYPRNPDQVEYRSRLKGFEKKWSKWSEKTRRRYTNLPEGTYTFQVKARNVYLKESRTSEYRFRILPPWYRTRWAYAGYGTAGSITLAMMAWLWVRKRRADRRAKEYLEGLEKANVEIRREKEKVEEAHQEITQSIDYAQKIQFALLQSEERLSSHLPEHFILFKPYSQVSGDFYWAQEHKGYFYIAAVDCTGHGVPGAFMSMLGISQLHEIMNTDELLTPGYILTRLRERVVRELSGSDPESAAKDGMDAAIVRLPIANPNSKGEGMEVQFAGAQNPLYVIRKGIAKDPPSASMEYQGEEREGDPVKPFKKSDDGIEIKGDGQPVGYDEYAKDAFTTVKLSLRKGDMCYFFSDGYADQFGGPKGKKFRYGPFKQLLVSLHEKPLEEQQEALNKTFEDWKNESGQEQIDDVVVIGVRL